MGAAMDMNAEKLRELKKLLIGLGQYRQMDMTGLPLDAYAEDLIDLELEKIGYAIKAIRTTIDYKPFAALVGLIRQKVLGNEKDEALEAANRILQAMSNFGWTNPEAAREFIGELGWRVVQREGGWLALCERTINDDLPILKAQWRELAAATMRREQSGITDAPALPSPQNESVKLIHSMASNLVRKLT